MSKEKVPLCGHRCVSQLSSLHGVRKLQNRAGVAERKPRKLATNISDLIRPYWSSDGQWIYFRSEESGKAGIYRCPASGGDAVLLSKDTDG
jgi:Tol biopolymer transport system component